MNGVWAQWLPKGIWDGGSMGNKGKKVDGLIIFATGSLDPLKGMEDASAPGLFLIAILSIESISPFTCNL